jgi:hypothetical protein
MDKVTTSLFKWEDIEKQFFYVTIDANDDTMYAHTNPPRHSRDEMSYINTHLSKICGYCDRQPTARKFKRPKNN